MISQSSRSIFHYFLSFIHSWIMNLLFTFVYISLPSFTVHSPPFTTFHSRFKSFIYSLSTHLLFTFIYISLPSFIMLSSSLFTPFHPKFKPSIYSLITHWFTFTLTSLCFLLLHSPHFFLNPILLSTHKSHIFYSHSFTIPCPPSSLLHSPNFILNPNLLPTH